MPDGILRLLVENAWQLKEVVGRRMMVQLSEDIKYQTKPTTDTNTPIPAPTGLSIMSYLLMKSNCSK